MEPGGLRLNYFGSDANFAMPALAFGFEHVLQ
jgi:hypothetical protein